ncbi:MAG: methyltransferase domain-containing protein [Phycisphaerae bacterium]
MSVTMIGVEQSVKQTYSRAALEKQESLCCPVSYDPKYLKIIPQEVLDRDYGCGDPSQFLRPGDTVLDLGSGGGKICFIAAQVVGPQGRVIGVDMNDDMLSLAGRNRAAVVRAMGYDNIEFRKGMIQDLQLNLADTEDFLRQNPVTDVAQWQALQTHQEMQRRQRPLVADESVDVIVSNCVLNLVRPADKSRLFSEMFRVLRMGGRVAISDIVSDEDVPQELQNDPELWSGCISGAWREDAFVEAFERAGFFGVRLAKRDSAPWRTVKGIEFRSVTIVAYKGKQGPCLERNQALIYAGPWKQVMDDDGHLFVRGKRMAVCDKTFRIMTNSDGPYAGSIFGIEPRQEVPVAQAKSFNCKGIAFRDPRQSKGLDYDATTDGSSPCTTDGCC